MKISLTEISKQINYDSIVEMVRNVIKTGVLENNLFYKREFQNGIDIKSKVVFELDLDEKQYVKDGILNKNQALEIYKWFRVLGIKNHFKFTCNDNLITLLRKDVYNLLLTTPGTSFSPKPILADYSNDCCDLIEETKIIQYHLANTINHKKIMHEQSNWWGLFKLYGFHQQIFGSNSKIETYEKDKENDLEYNILKTTEEVDANSYILTPKEIEKIKNKTDLLNLHQFNVVYIDDHANDGWSDIIIDIIYGNTGKENDGLFVINPQPDNTVDDIYKEYLTKTKDKEIHLIICDLRLSKNEEEETDYTKLKSFQVIQKINYKHSTRLMYCTSANSLYRYRKMVDIEKHRPHKLFIRESITFNFSKKQSFDNYIELINNISGLLKHNAPKKKEGTEKSDNQVPDENINATLNKFSSIKDENLIANEIRFPINKTDLIVFDTNFFLDTDKLNKNLRCFLAVKEKALLNYGVIKELEWKSRDPNFRLNYLAKFYLELIYELKIKQSTAFCSNYLLKKWENNRPGEEEVDPILIDMVDQLTKDNACNVLFVSNDRKPGIFAGKQINNKGPYTILQQLKADYNIDNLMVLLVYEFISKIKFNADATN